MTPKRYAFNNLVLTIREWSERTGLSIALIHSRLEKGWSIERALTAPPRGEQTYIAFNGEIRPLTQWAREIGIGRRMLADRLDAGWPVERALTEPNKRTAARK